MRVVIGPVDVRSAEAFVGYAHRALDDVTAMAPGECFTTPEVIAALRGFVDVWEDAVEGAEFLWDEDLPAEQVEYNMHALQRVAGVLSERGQREGRQMPLEAEDFYMAMLHGFLIALEAEGPSSAAYAKHLAEFWPGRERIC